MKILKNQPPVSFLTTSSITFFWLFIAGCLSLTTNCLAEEYLIAQIIYLPHIHSEFSAPKNNDRLNSPEADFQMLAIPALEMSFSTDVSFKNKRHIQYQDKPCNVKMIPDINNDAIQIFELYSSARETLLDVVIYQSEFQTFDEEPSLTKKTVTVLINSQQVLHTFRTERNEVLTDLSALRHAMDLYLAGYSWKDTKQLLELGLSKQLYHYALDHAGQQRNIPSAIKRLKATVSLNNTLCKGSPFDQRITQAMESSLLFFFQHPDTVKKLTAEQSLACIDMLQSNDADCTHLLEHRFSANQYLTDNRKPTQRLISSTISLPLDNRQLSLTEPSHQVIVRDPGQDVILLPVMTSKGAPQNFKNPFFQHLPQLAQNSIEILPIYASFFPEPLLYRYQPISYLAGSGEGMVFLCRDLVIPEDQHNHLVALKLYSRQVVNPKGRPPALFQNKGLPVSLAAVFNHGWCQCQYFQVLEYLPFSLKHFHTVDSRLPEPYFEFFALQLFITLQELHQQHMVYRDFKPDNIMLDSSGNVTVIDLGGLALIGENNQPANPFGFTPGYSPDEKGRENPYHHDRFGMSALLLHERLGVRFPDLASEVEKANLQYTYIATGLSEGKVPDTDEECANFLAFLYQLKKIRPLPDEIDFLTALLQGQHGYSDTTVQISHKPFIKTLRKKHPLNNH